MIWKDVPGYSRIQASDTGLIRIKQRDIRIVQRNRTYIQRRVAMPAAQYKHPETGYLTCGVREDSTGKTRPVGVHRLVCLAFHGRPPPGKPNALHRNGVRTFNIESNVYWGSHKENEDDKQKHGRRHKGERHHITTLTALDVVAIKRRYKPKCRKNGSMAIAREYGVHRTTIENIISGRTWIA